jgi:hypothetical protein
MSNDIADILGHEFDASAVEIRQDHEPIPAGWYNAIIDEAAVKDTKDGTGKRLALTFIVLNEPHDGRRIFTGINLANKNQQAVEIGQRELAALSIACGISNLSDSATLLNKPLAVKVKVYTNHKGDPDNEVKAYKSLGQPAAPSATAAKPKPAPVAAKPAAAKPAPTAAAKRPWER